MALRGHDKTDSLDNPGIFMGLPIFMGIVLEEHLKMANVFKGMSKTVQNELLDCILSMLKDYILEVKSANFISIQADETFPPTASWCLCYATLIQTVTSQSVFFEFITIQNVTADTIATALLERLSTIIPNGQKAKLIALAKIRATIMRGATSGVQHKILDVYENANYVHYNAKPHYAAGNITHPQDRHA